MNVKIEEIFVSILNATNEKFVFELKINFFDESAYEIDFP